MRARTPRLLVLVYAVFGAFAVHTLRYALAPTASANAGHGYLGAVPPLLAALLAMALARFAVAVLDRRRMSGRSLPWAVRWLLGAAAFVTLFSAQENAETLLTFGHPAGPSAVLAHGGWTVLPLALLAGGLLAVLLRGTEEALERLSSALTGHVRRLPRPSAVALQLRPAPAPRVPAVPVLALHLAGRAPPTTS
jgi:uncharacterized membrane protein YgdD (TMEM256/DUF423 family)